jgi:hypothetical protein
MPTRRNVCFSIGCILVVAVVGTMVGGCGKNQTPPSDSFAIAKTVGSTNVNDTAVATPARRPETPLPDPYFRLTVKSKTDIELAAEHDTTDNEVELKYAHQKTNNGIILVFYSMEAKKRPAGALTQDLLMTRDKLVNLEGNDRAETSFDELSQKWQEGLAGAFATGLCEITLDTNRNEIGRQMLSPNKMGLVGDENLNLVRLMHGPYPIGMDRWQTTNGIPTTYSFVIHCPVTCSRTGDANNVIKMDGTFTNEAMDSPADGVTFKHVWCSFAGRETFDQPAGEYTSGEAAFEYKFQIYQGDNLIATVDRHANLALEQMSARGK